MSGIIFRQCQKKDQNEIQNVCYQTGYMGEDLTGKDLFNDQRLFGYLFCLYYPRYEAEHGFVAVDTNNNNRIVGYILGSPDSKKQGKQFNRKMVWRIALRLYLFTRWKYPESFRAVQSFRKIASQENEPGNLYEKYPAHLHIDILPEYQRKGIGSRLMQVFEQHMRDLGVPGIHLGTSNHNTKALPFYKKQGYQIISEKESTFWPDVKNYKALIFAKKL
ncbi:MAG: GNAT family N-acetyltransferase [Candidatus Hodarchaeota archaeon]